MQILTKTSDIVRWDFKPQSQSALVNNITLLEKKLLAAFSLFMYDLTTQPKFRLITCLAYKVGNKINIATFNY
jgi:hypothetical protein